MIATIILLVIMALSTGVHLAKNGQPQTGKYTFWGKLVADAIILTLYYYAGIFNNF
jgi:hypothetical protein